MSRIRGDTIAKELVEALGIDGANVTSFNFHCHAGEVAYADVRLLIPIDKVGAMKEVLRRYKFVLKEE